MKVVLVIVVLIVAAVIYATFPPSSAPSESEIRATIESSLHVALPEEIRVIESKSWEAPFYQIHGVTHTEEAVVSLTREDFDRLSTGLLERHVVRVESDSNLSGRISHRRGELFYSFSPSKREISYQYIER